MKFYISNLMGIVPWIAETIRIAKFNGARYTSYAKLKIIPRLAVILLLILNTSLQISGSTYEQKITLTKKEATLLALFKEIQTQSGYDFIYSDRLLNKAKKINIHIKDASLIEVLEKCFQDQPFTYMIKEKTIIVKEKESITSPPTKRETAQAFEIKGKVVNQEGAALQGVSVVIVGTTNGTITDNNGLFLLTTANRGTVTLEFSSIGFQQKTLTAGSDEAIDVVMDELMGDLDDVVVVGYGTQRKQDITGSVSVVDMKATKNIPSGSALQALQGQSSGVNVMSSGMPGGGSTVFIRGVTSFGDTGPLVLVDGVPSSLDNMRSDEIESIQVLKDAGAAAIYGVRGANGVIIVTTKKGRVSQPVVTYDSFYGQQQPLKKNAFNLLNSEDFMKLTLIANPASKLFKDGMPDYLYAGPTTNGAAKAGDPAVDPSMYAFDPSNTPDNYLIQEVNKTGTDWFREVFKSAPTINHNLAVSGGTEKSNYSVSLGYFDQKGTLIETYLKRYSMKVNTEFKVRDNIRIGQNIYAFNKRDQGIANLSVGNSISHIYRIMPIIPVYDINGNYGGTYVGPELGSGENPVALQERTKNNRNNNWSAVGNVFVEIDFIKDLTFRTSVGGTISNSYGTYFTFNSYNDAFFNNRENGLSESSGYSKNLIVTNTLSYSNQFGKHSFKALVGTESLKDDGRNVGGSANGFFSTDRDYLILGNGTKDLTASSSAYEQALFSVFGRVDYAFHNKYLLGLTVRRDGSSRFGSESRYGTFPSVSAGWRLSDENFLSNVEWINDLKVKGSFGVLGSQNNVNPENAYSVYGSAIGNSYYDLNGTGLDLQQGFYQARNGNPFTSWEENLVTNLGLDASLFRNKLELSAEYYRKSVKGLLFPEPLPATAGGAAAPTINIGDIRNQGIDISALYRGRIKDDFTFNIGANFTTYKNKVVNIPDPGYFEVAGGGSIIGSLVRNQVGQPVSSFFGYEVIGLFNSDEDVASSPTQDQAKPGRFKYRDADNDGEITPDDRVFFGNPNPDFTYGLNLGVDYKSFSLASTFYGSQGNDVLNHVRYFTDFFSNPGGKSNVLLDAWTPENTNTTVPKIESVSTFSTSGAPNSYYMENGSFLKLKSVMLGYTFQSTLLKNYGINNLKVYLQATNLFTITKYKGLDPELSGSSASFGIDFGNYPNNQRNFLAGLSVSF